MNRPLTAIALVLSITLASCSKEEPPKPYAVEEVS